MKSIKYLFLAAGLSASVVACKQVDYKKTPGGLSYQLYEGEGKEAGKEGNYLKVNIESILNVNGKDSSVFSSFTGLPLYIPINPQIVRPYDVSELFASLKKGDSVVATQLMDSFLVQNPMLAQQGYKNGDQVITRLKVIDIIDNDSLRAADEKKEKEVFIAKEGKDVEKYLADNKITATKTPKGAYVAVTNPGDGALVIDSGMYVSINYTGTSFSGKVFDSNVDPAFNHVEPLNFTLNVTPMIEGFNQGLKGLKKGAKAKIFVPSTLGYGGNPQSPNIKPYEHLMFDVEVLDVATKAPVQK